MGKINRYDQATPAKDNYFNTFVPLPLENLMAIGMARKQELEKNQSLLDKALDDAIDIKYIKESPFEEANYRNIAKGVTDLAMEYRTKDLTNPIEFNNMKRKLKAVADPTLIKRMEESYAGHQQYRALQADLMSKGQWNDKLNKNKAASHNSQTGVFNELPQAYIGREKLLAPYLDKIHPSLKGIQVRDGIPFVMEGVDERDVAKVANERAAELISTPAGQQELELFKMDYPNDAKRLGSDTAIMNQIMRDYAQRYESGTPLSGEMAKLWFASQNPQTDTENELHGTNAANVNSFYSLPILKQEISKLEAQENPASKQQAKDLQIALDNAMKKYGIDEKKFLDFRNHETSFLVGAGTVLGTSVNHDKSQITDKENENMKKALNEVSSTLSTKYSFGFPAWTSGNLSMSVNSSGDKIGVNDLHYISNQALNSPGNFELLSINGEKVPKDKKTKTLFSKMNTGNLIDAKIEILPDANYDFKPTVTLQYEHVNSDGIATRNEFKMAITDGTVARGLAEVLAKRGDNVAATAMIQPDLAAAVAYDDFDTEKGQTYYIKYKDSNTGKVDRVPINVKRNPENTNQFVTNYVGALNADGSKTKTFNHIAANRQELIAQLYDLVSKNRGRFEK